MQLVLVFRVHSRASTDHSKNLRWSVEGDDMKEISITARLAFAATAMTIFLGACAVAPPSASNKDTPAFTPRRLVKFRDMSEFEEYRDQVHRAAKARRVRWSQLSSGAPSALL